MSAETWTVVLSEAAFATLCGLVQPSEEVEASGIYSEAWEELRDKFPLSGFLAAVAREVIEYDADAGA